MVSSGERRWRANVSPPQGSLTLVLSLEGGDREGAVSLGAGSVAVAPWESGCQPQSQGTTRVVTCDKGAGDLRVPEHCRVQITHRKQCLVFRLFFFFFKEPDLEAR